MDMPKKRYLVVLAGIIGLFILVSAIKNDAYIFPFSASKAVNSTVGKVIQISGPEGEVPKELIKELKNGKESSN